MNRSKLIDIFKKVCQRLMNNPDRCVYLLYTQKSSNKHKIREPEAAFVLAAELSSQGYDFGLEVPTQYKYCFTGKTGRCGRSDLAISPFKDDQINIEIKEGSTNIVSLGLAFQKLLQENVQGCAIYHVLHNANRGTLPALLTKYKKAHLTAKKKLSPKTIHPKWFVLFIMVKRKKKCWYNDYADITNIKKGKLNKLSGFTQSQCHGGSKYKTTGAGNTAGWELNK